MKDCQVDPLEQCFRSSLREIKVFTTFKNWYYLALVFLKTYAIFPSKTLIKMERLLSGPSRALLSQFSVAHFGGLTIITTKEY